MSKKDRKQGKDEASWQVIRDSLEMYQPERLAGELRKFLSARVPRGTTHIGENQRLELFKQVQGVIAANVGPWYTLSHLYLGNYVIGGYSYESFFKGKGSPGMDLERNIQRMLDALHVSRQWLHQLDAHFRAVTLPEDEPGFRAALSAAVRGAIEITVQATSCEDAWYAYADNAVAWLMQSLGFRMTDNMQRVLSRALGGFESWHSPSEADSLEASEQIALEVVKKGFARKYPR